MTTVVIVFMIVATIFALATLLYVAVDVVMEKGQKKQAHKQRNREMGE